VGENRRRFKSHLLNAEPAGQACPPRAHPAMGVRRWRDRGGRPRERAPHRVESWTAGYLSKPSGEARRRCPVAGRQPSEPRDGEWVGPHRGRRAGQAFRGVARERGSALWLLVTGPEEGDRVSKGPGGVWGFDQITRSWGTPRAPRHRQGSRARAPSDGA
jgi:hypothetical protein